MKESTKHFIKSKFSEYYRKTKLRLPPGLEKREWGFVPFDTHPKIMMKRHKSFASHDSFVRFLRLNAPAHVYHSSAYYQHPNTPSMDEKGWMGADLVFDLDADHLPNPPDSYEEMLERVKRETIKLLEFLINDFGLRNIQLAFSGSRGYHVHARDDCVLKLGSQERKEIVDFITSRGLDINIISDQPPIEKGLLKRCYRCNKTTTKYVCPICGSPTRELTIRSREDKHYKISRDSSWGRKILDYLDELSKLSEKEGMEDLVEIKGIGSEKARDIYRQARKGKKDQVRESLGKDIGEKLSVNILGGKSDEPVTADTKRLIRCPRSLHGKTGLQVKPLLIDELDDFNPLSDAVVFGNNPVTVRILKPTELSLCDTYLSLDEGTTELPEYVAIFLTCRGKAEYES